jgi:hypothetical protein
VSRASLCCRSCGACPFFHTPRRCDVQAALEDSAGLVVHDQLGAELEDLLVIPAGGRQTPLDRLRTAPVRACAAGLLDALSRLYDVRAICAGRLDLSGLPPGRVKVLARYAAAARAQAIARMPEHRRIATLLAFAHLLEATAQDDAIDPSPGMPRSSTPAASPAQSPKPTPTVAFPHWNTVGHCTISVTGPQSLHSRCGLPSLCLRLVMLVTSHDAKLDRRWLAGPWRRRNCTSWIDEASSGRTPKSS